MTAKIGRNDPCWCGSGKKFKKCHIDRASQEAMRPWEVDAYFRKRSEKGKCLHVGATVGSICSKPAIRSHTVVRKMLKQIAKDGHVYHEGATIQDLEKTHGQLVIKRIGVNDASVLPIFCEAHDAGAFVPLEQAPFTGSKEQCALLAYRALCYELAKKQQSLNSVPVMKGFDRGKEPPHQAMMQTMLTALEGAYQASVRDSETHKQQFDSMLLSRDYSALRAYVVTFEDVPEILCAGGIFPECDFAGNALQYLGDLSKTMDEITFSLIATERGGAFVFAWHDSSTASCLPLATSLDALSDDELPHAIVRFISEFCENRYFKPEWWDGSDKKAKEALTSRFRTSISSDKIRAVTCLVDDGVRAVSWKVTGRAWL
jgi:hypothetical protein